jgi:hypothetical protein
LGAVPARPPRLGREIAIKARVAHGVQPVLELAAHRTLRTRLTGNAIPLARIAHAWTLSWTTNVSCTASLALDRRTRAYVIEEREVSDEAGVNFALGGRCCFPAPGSHSGAYGRFSRCNRVRCLIRCSAPLPDACRSSIAHPRIRLVPGASLMPFHELIRRCLPATGAGIRVGARE